MKKVYQLVKIITIYLTLGAGSLFANEGLGKIDIISVVEAQKYNRAIHIMVMLLIGFGFLMAFMKNYGRSALTATFLIVSTSIPLYFLLDNQEIFGASNLLIDKMILSEFAAAGVLIAAGALLGRLKMYQYIILAILFVLFYITNEWIVLENGFGFFPEGVFVDTGGSIIIHTFGAFFGVAVALTMTTKNEYETEVKVTETSEMFSMLGSMALWIFWPSFCGALVIPELIPMTVTNVILSLCGSTIATYVSTVVLRKKISIADIANASLAGGVAIGSTCDKVGAGTAIIIGILAGILSTFGFAKLQSIIEGIFKKTDTCGVLYLHGLPGLLGGIAALVVVKGINVKVQILGILFTVVVAVLTGIISGKIIALFGRKVEAYNDSEELEEVL